MTETEYRELMIAEITDLKSSFVHLADILTQKMEAFETKIEMVMENTEGRLKGKYELLERDIDGLSERVEEKVKVNEARLIKVENCELECVEKRKSIHEKADKTDVRITNHIDTEVAKIEKTQAEDHDDITKLKVKYWIVLIACGGILAALITFVFGG